MTDALKSAIEVIEQKRLAQSSAKLG